MKRVLLILSVLAVICSSAMAEDKKVEATVSLDKEEYVFGDRVNLSVTAVNTKGMEVYFSDAPEDPGDFSFIESYPLKSGQPPGRVYVLGIYTTGLHVIPPVKVQYRSPDETDWKAITSRQFPIDVKSLLTGKDTDVRDIKGLLVFGAGGVLITGIIILVIAVAALVALVWWRVRRRKILAEEVKFRSAYEIAHEELEELKEMDLPGHGKVKEYYICLSDITRHYLENRFSYRAPEMTTEEFLNFVKTSRDLKDEHRKLLKRFLTHCDMVKFAKYGPTPIEILDSFRAAEGLVDQTKREQEETED